MTAEPPPLPLPSGVSEADLGVQARVPALALPHMDPADLTDTAGLHIAVLEELTAQPDTASQPAASEQTEQPETASQPAGPEKTDASPTSPGSHQPVTREYEADTMPEPQEAASAPAESEAAPQAQLNLSHPSSQLLATSEAPEMADHEHPLLYPLPAEKKEQELRYTSGTVCFDAARLSVQQFRT